MNAWLPQASYPCGNFSDTSRYEFRTSKGSIGHAFTVCIHTENQNQMSFYPFALHEISVLIELILGHLRYRLTDVPPQPNSPPDSFFNLDRGAQSDQAAQRTGTTTSRQHCCHRRRNSPVIRDRPRPCIAHLMLEASRFREILPN